MNEYEKDLIDEKFDTICNQMIRLHEENLELKKKLEELENKVERRWQAQQKARQKVFKMAEMISGQFLKSMNINMPLLKLIIESNTKGRKESHNKYLAKRSYKTFTEKCKF